jgi:hypothetical protein
VFLLVGALFAAQAGPQRQQGLWRARSFQERGVRSRERPHFRAVSSESTGAAQSLCSMPVRGFHISLLPHAGRSDEKKRGWRAGSFLAKNVDAPTTLAPYRPIAS